MKSTRLLFHKTAKAIWQKFSSVTKMLIRNLDPSVWNRKQRLVKMKDLYAGNRCFIMGNGPSLNLMNLKLFEKEFVWGSNKCYLLFERINWRPSFYVAVDRRVVPDIAKELKSFFIDKTITFFFPIVFRENLGSGQNVFWFDEKEIDESKGFSGAFSYEVESWMSSAHTVTVSALQLAVYLGFDPIYLIGCDTDYKIPSTVKIEGRDSNHLISTRNDDPNHFAPNYFGKGAKYHYPHVNSMIRHYELAKLACDEIGIRVINATVGGRLEVFPRVEYETLFD